MSSIDNQMVRYRNIISDMHILEKRKNPLILQSLALTVSLQYLMTTPPNGHVWHKAFFGVSESKAVAHTRPAFPKMLMAPSAFPLIGVPQASGDESNPTKWVQTYGERPPEAEEYLQVPRYIRPDPCRRWHGRPKCYPATGEVKYHYSPFPMTVLALNYPRRLICH